MSFNFKLKDKKGNLTDGGAAYDIINLSGIGFLNIVVADSFPIKLTQKF